MSADDTNEGPDDEDDATDSTRRDELTDRLSDGTDRAVESFDQRLVDLLSWMLDTETRARIYVHLRQAPHSTSDEIAEGTGLYPSTVREALAELHEEEVVERRKRQSEGAGNNPYEYAAIAPSELVGSVADQVQTELNTVFNLDTYLGDDEDPTTDDEPVTITVEDASGSDDGTAEIDDRSTDVDDVDDAADDDEE